MEHIQHESMQTHRQKKTYWMCQMPNAKEQEL